ncbi:MAG: LacI family transcriptional regulator [Turicibacter sp.]|nr:LacI family transcriptional regulator [Turicibacter sp.]
MPTIKDIATMTGFSVTTVSRALNDYNDVNAQTKKKIEDAAEKIGYVPNILAQNLVMKKSKTIGILVNELKRESSKDGLMLEMLCGVSDVLADSDYEFVLLSTSTAKQKNKTFKQLCEERQLAGLIIQGLKNDDPYLEEIVDSNVPCVLIDILITNETTKYVTSNQIESIKDAIKYLHRLGHCAIAYMNGSDGAHVSTIRKQGYLEALKEIGLPAHENYIMNGQFDEDIAKKVAMPFLLNHPEVTAVFCASDVMAIGVLSAAKDLSIKVPEKLSVIGFDNIVLSRYSTPPLTTISQSPYNMAAAGTELLTAMIEKKQEKTPFKILNSELIIRESTTFQGSV